MKIVLLRGLLRDARHWGEFVLKLGRALPQAEIICLDIPGNGKRYREKSPLSIELMTEGLRGELSKHETKQKVYLIAISMGGMIAMDWFARYPEEIASAVLINASSRTYTAFYQRLRWVNYPRIIGTWFFGTLFARTLFADEHALQRMILALTSNRHDTEEIVTRWVTWHHRAPVSLLNALRQLVAAMRFRCTILPVIPVFIIYSEQDQLVNAECSRALASNWHCKSVSHTTAGHDLPLDDPDWVVGQIVDFFECNQSATKTSLD